MSLPGGTPTLAERIAEFASHWSGDFSDDLRHQIQRGIMNSVGAAVAARNHKLTRTLHEYLGEPKQGRAARIMWQPWRHEPADAAMINASMMHVLDFDDTYIPTTVHTFAPIIGAAMAAADCRKMSGSEFIGLILLGTEVQLRLGAILHPNQFQRGFHATSVTSAIGAATLWSRASQLDEAQITTAIGIAVTGSAAILENCGTDVKAYGVGSAVRAGIVAAELSSRGIDASAAALDGPRGAVVALAGRDRLDSIDAELEDLGQRWTITRGMMFKRYSTCTWLQAALEAVLEIRSRLEASAAADVRTIHVRPDVVIPVVLEPTDPANELAAKFDFRYCIAAAWVDGIFTERQMMRERFTDPRILNLRSRVTVESVLSLSQDAADVTVVLADGTQFNHTSKGPKGTAENPLTDLDLEEKLREAGAGFVPAGQIDLAIKCIWDLHHRDNAADLLDALSRPV